MKYLKIGEMARLNNISVQTLRYYDEINLLKPVYIDPLSNYRYYDLAQSARLDMILFLKSLEFSLDEIKNLLEDSQGDVYMLERIAAKKKRFISMKSELDIKIELIKQFENAYDDYLKNKDSHDYSVHFFEERRIYKYNIQHNIYEMTLIQYEKYLRKFKLHLESVGLGSQYFSRVGSIVEKEKFINGDFISNTMFLFLPMDKNIENTEILKSGHYLIVYCDSFDNELPMLHGLYAFIQRNNLVIDGDYICEVIYEIPYEKDLNRHMFIRLQVPIKEK